jgi:hypothetical protein
MLCKELPNGLRYPQVGGRGLRLRGSKNSKPEKYSSTAQTPTCRVHALLATVLIFQTANLINVSSHDSIFHWKFDLLRREEFPPTQLLNAQLELRL